MLEQFLQCEPKVVEDVLRDLRSVIIPPYSIREVPRIYHPSFADFIVDPSRCTIRGFAISIPMQERRHALRCFEILTTLKRDIAGIKDASLLNCEVDGFEERVGTAISPQVQYACRYWASHLSDVEFRDETVMQALEDFSTRSLLWWLEVLSLIQGVPIAVGSLYEALRWVVCLLLRNNLFIEVTVTFFVDELEVQGDSHRTALRCGPLRCRSRRGDLCERTACIPFCPTVRAQRHSALQNVLPGRDPFRLRASRRGGALATLLKHVGRSFRLYSLHCIFSRRVAVGIVFRGLHSADVGCCAGAHIATLADHSSGEIGRAHV